jgi:hypothetical protein
VRVLSEKAGEFLESESSSDSSGNTALVDKRYRSDEAGEEVVAGLLRIAVVGLHQSWLRKLAALSRPW